MKKVPANCSRIRRSLLTALLLFGSVTVGAQTSLFQDAFGESAYKVLGSAVTLNPADENISASVDIYNRRKRGIDSGSNFRRFGLSLRIGANEGLVNLNNATGFLIDGQVGIYHSWITTSKITDPDAWVRVIYLNGNFLIDREQVYNSDYVSTDGVYAKGYGGWRLESGIYGFKGNLLWGVSLSGGQKTNIDYLSPNTISILQPASNDSVLVWDASSAYDDAALAGGLGYLNANADVAYLINRQSVTSGSREIPPMFVAASLRYRVLEGQVALFNPGLGIYMSRTGAPQDVMLGMSVQLKDAFDAMNTETTAWKRMALNLTVGYKFGN